MRDAAKGGRLLPMNPAGRSPKALPWANVLPPFQG
jgi:hypothetical protein